MNKEEFINELKKINVNITKEQLDKLDELYKYMIEYNKNVNLTRITNEKDVYLKHYYDSLTIIKAIDLKNNSTLCDIGTGAGFPGLVLKIVFPKLKITLVDSLNKRIIYLKKVIELLDLKDIEAIHSRGQDIEKKYDIVVSRAVARIDKISNICLPIVKKNGVFIAMKANFDEEENYISKGQIYNLIKFKLPIEKSQRTLVVIKK